MSPAPRRRDLVPPLLLVLGAPGVVILTLQDLRLTFLAYHLGACLLLPLAISLREGRGLRGHARLLGLTPLECRSVREGLLTGLLAGGGTLVFFVVAGDRVLDPARAAAAMAGWGVTVGRDTWLVAFMLLLNGPAEELFWRGWLHGRLAAVRPRALPLAGATLAYASYHLATLHALLPSWGAVLPAFAGVLAAGAWWAWRRERHGGVWAPLLGHAGATAGYMAIYVAFVA